MVTEATSSCSGEVVGCTLLRWAEATVSSPETIGSSHREISLWRSTLHDDPRGNDPANLPLRGRRSNDDPRESANSTLERIVSSVAIKRVKDGLAWSTPVEIFSVIAPPLFPSSCLRSSPLLSYLILSGGPPFAGRISRGVSKSSWSDCLWDRCFMRRRLAWRVLGTGVVSWSCRLKISPEPSTYIDCISSALVRTFEHFRENRDRWSNDWDSVDHVDADRVFL